MQEFEREESEKSDLFLDDNFEVSGDTSIFDEINEIRKKEEKDTINKTLKEISDNSEELGIDDIDATAEQTALGEMFHTKMYKHRDLGEVFLLKYKMIEDSKERTDEQYSNIVSDKEELKILLNTIDAKYKLLKDYDDLEEQLIKNLNKFGEDLKGKISEEHKDRFESINYEVFSTLLGELLSGGNAKVIMKMIDLKLR